MTAMFADDSAKLKTDEDQQTATDQLQRTLNNISDWTKRWKIKINSDESIHINYTLRKSIYCPVLLQRMILKYSY